MAQSALADSSQIQQNFNKNAQSWYILPNSGNLANTTVDWKFYGKTVLSTAAPDTSDRHKGIIESPVFTLNTDLKYDGKVSFFQGSGDKQKYKAPNECYFAVYDAKTNKEITRTYGNGQKAGVQQILDLQTYKGKDLYFRLVDKSSGGWGHIAIDDFTLQGKINKQATYARRPAHEISEYDTPANILVDLNDKSAKTVAQLPLPASLQITNSKAQRPVTWIDNDNYNNKISGDYTFTAKLGELPKGKLQAFKDDNPETVTLSVKVRNNAATGAQAFIGTLSASEIFKSGQITNHKAINDSNKSSIAKIDSSHSSHAFVGVKWNAPRQDFIESVALSLNSENNSGWFNHKFKAKTKAAEPILQATSNGQDWVTIGQVNNYRKAIDAVQNSKGQLPEISFKLHKALTKVTGIRVLGLSDTSLQVRELKVLTTSQEAKATQTLPSYDVTITSLLDELLDRDAKTRFPSNYTLDQFSSYERKSDHSSKAEGKSGNSPEWYANFDFSHFIRKEINDGRTEYVMMDHSGPGAITRWWMTFITADFNDNSTIRVYIDGSNEPIIEEHPMELLSRGDFGGKVLASSSSPETTEFQRGHNLYLPIAYSSHCKVTIESKSLDGTFNDKKQAGGTYVYYNINYRDYKDNLTVQPFTKGDIDIRPKLMDKINAELLNAAPTKLPEASKISDTIAPEKTKILAKINGPKAIQKIDLKLDTKNLNQALRSTVLSINFDGKESVWIPVGEFFGTGYKISPYKSRYTEVLADGNMCASFVMPFARNAEISLINYGKQNVRFTASINSTDRKWTSDSLYFHAKWHEYNRFKSKGNRHHHEGNAYDLNYIDITGKGVYIADTLTLFNSATGSDYGNRNLWWGEGDEKIYIDGEKFPSHFGTGTEDYYGYAWCRPQKFHTPFITQPDGSGNKAPGFTVNSRYRILDDLPFSKSLKFDMELWTWKTCTMNFAPAIFYYAEKSATDNIKKDIENVKKAVVLKREEIYQDPK